jgi:hypothetical protein
MKEPYEKEVAICLSPESCAATARDTVKRRQGIGGVATKAFRALQNSEKMKSGRRRPHNLALQLPRTAANTNFANHQNLLNHIQDP